MGDSSRPRSLTYPGKIRGGLHQARPGWGCEVGGLPGLAAHPLAAGGSVGPFNAGYELEVGAEVQVSTVVIPAIV